MAHIVHDSPAEVTPRQVTALAQTLRRSPAVIKQLIEEARDTFNADALDYAKMHKETVIKALASEDPKALEVARKGAAWALTNISHEGKRVVDKPDTGPKAGQVLIGIRIGGIKQETVEALPVVMASEGETHE